MHGYLTTAPMLVASETHYNDKTVRNEASARVYFFFGSSKESETQGAISVIH